MKEYSIWSEGYAATGNRSGAIYFGTKEGVTFKDACIRFFTSATDKTFFDKERLSYWGCKLFDNETDARRSFG